jgi:hypothetical protein
MFRCYSLVELIFLHIKNKSNDMMVHSVCDSKAWKHIDDTWPNFATNPHNIRLGLALDGVNPYVDLSTNHSTWPLLFLNYNLPPWLTKRFFVMLTLLILGKTFVKNENIDVYLQPLMEELEIIQKGVKTINVTRLEGSQAYFFRAICMRNIHNYHAYM